MSVEQRKVGIVTMADFGLAAQIGRGGGGGGGMSQQQDPQNRMLQIMQLQQLQQNMMLAREQEGRAAGLYGLQRGTLEETLNNLREAEKRAAGTYVPDLARKETDLETAKLQQRMQLVQTNLTEGAFNVKTRLLKLRSSMEPGVMMSPDFQNKLMRYDPELAVELDRLVTEGKKIRSEQEKAGYDATTARMAQQKAIVGSIANSLGGVVDQQTFTTVLNELTKVDPLAVELIGSRFNAESMLKLERRMRGLQNYEIKENAQGNFVRINLDDNTSTIVGSRVLPDVNPNPEGDAATYDAARTLGAAPPPSALPGAPYTPPPGVGPKAAAAGEKKAAELAAQKAVDDVKKREGQTKTQDTLNGMIDAYKKLGAQGELQRKDMSTGERLRIAAQARLPGDVATAFNFDAGSELTTISNLRQALIPVLTEIMGAKSADAASESQRIVDSLTTGGQSPASIARTLTDFSKKYGLGVTFKPEDLAYTPPAGATGSARGRPAPAAGQPAAPAPAAGKPTLQEFLAKARPANPNASDADLRTYYDRTYGGR